MPTDIDVQLRDVFARFAATVQRTNEMVAFGLASAADHSAPVRGIPNLRLRFQHWDRQFADAEMPGEFSLWVITNGFRDLAEAVAAFLEDVNATVASWDTGHSPNSRSRKGKSPSVAPDAFHRMDFPTKVARLQSAYGLAIEGQLLASVADVNAVRNCLVHRHGRVGKADVKRNGELRLTYKAIVVWITEPGGVRALFTEPRPVAANSEIALEEQWRRKAWQAGERVTLDANEFSDVANTVNHFGLWTQRAMAHVAWQRRLVEKAPPAMSAPLVNIEMAKH